MALISQVLLDDVARELRMKTSVQIDAETAARWGARAVVSYKRYLSTGNMAWYKRAVEFAHEAIEHAAAGNVVDQIRADLEQLTGKPW